ncbi:hypothetical protein [Desulfonatronum parangueonense]
MNYSPEIGKTLENTFQALPPEERAAVISHGVAVRFSELNKRLFLAESKVHFFQDKYKTTLSEIEGKGLPDDADYEMHEDYVMWSHWTDVIGKVKKQVCALQKIAELGVYR